MKKNKENISSYDAIIIGGGGAGLTAAINLAYNKKKVAVISKTKPILSHTSAAQGGINATLSTISEDKWEWHMYDTIKGSDWLCDQDSVEILSKESNNAIKFLESIGVNFDKTIDGKILQKKYGGQTTHFGKGDVAFRACSVGDRTGQEIMNKLFQEASKLEIEFINYFFAVDLIIQENKCYGLSCYDIERNLFTNFFAENIIISTGGYSKIFNHTTASNSLTGDGIGMVSRAGLPLKDMEFIQFHPTSMYGTGILLSETARSVGGKLINSKNHYFMQDYAPNLKDLAPRDIVSRSIALEIAKGNGCGENKDHIFLDLRKIDAKELEQKLPNLRQLCMSFMYLDPKNDLIPVTPSAHYTMGGIPTNSKCEVVNYHANHEIIVEGLYAIGEAACHSVHGANRLGCNSLLDIIVFGIEVTKTIISKSPNNQNLAIPSFALPSLAKNNGENSVDEITSLLKDICTNALWLDRDEVSLNYAVENIFILKRELNNIKLGENNSSWNNQFIKYLELRNLIECASHSVIAALNRKETRGAHSYKEYPNRNDQKYLNHSITKITNYEYEYFLQEVRKIQKNVEFFQLEERNY